MVDIHVYVIPTEFWRDSLNSVSSDAVVEAQSAGFVNVDPEVTLAAIRRDIYEQLQTGIVPQEFCFLRIVGRCLAKVSEKQELLLKAKSFLPPLSFSPDIYLIDSRVIKRGLRGGTGSNNSDATFSLPRLTPTANPPEPAGTSPDPIPKVLQLSHADFEHQRSGEHERNGLRRSHPNQAHESLEAQRSNGYAGDIAHFENQEPEKKPHQHLDDVEILDNFASPKERSAPEGTEVSAIKLELIKRERAELEIRRKGLLKKLHELQEIVQQKRKDAYEYWRARFVDEKGRTPYLEDQASALGKDIDSLHKRLVRQIGSNKAVDSTTLNHQLQALKLRQTVDLLKLKVEEGHTKLMCQIRLRNQAETELRAMRAELTQKKVLLQLLKSKLPADAVQ